MAIWISKKNNIFSLGVVVGYWLSFSLKNVICQTPCASDFSPLAVDESELQKLPENKFTPSKSYVVREGVTKVTINCTRRLPTTGWTATLGKGYVGKIKTTFHQQINTAQNPSAYFTWYNKIICHTSSIILEDFGESITGAYTCGSYTIWIFGGNDNPDTGSFLQGGHLFEKDTFEIKEEMDLYGYGRELALPCAQNYPKGVVLQYDSFDGSKSVTFIQGISRHFASCREQFFCVELDHVFNETGRTIYDGFTLTCKTVDSSNAKDTVSLISSPTKDLAVFPKESAMNLTVSSGHKQRFSCYSVRPVRVETSHRHTRLNVDNETLDNYYRHKSSIEITLSDKDWKSRQYVNVFCNDEHGHPLHRWLYGFTNLLQESDNKRSSSDIPMEASENSNITTKQLIYGHCTSLDPKSAKVFFLPCSTYIECRMKVSFLYLSQSQKLVTKQLRNGVKFELPRNSSGMIRCVGFQKDYSLVMFPTVDEKPFSHHALRIENDQQKDLDFYDPIVTVNSTQIYAGDFIRAQCKIPLMLIITHPAWIILFKNGTQYTIPTANLVNDTTEIISEVYTVSTTIKIESTDVVGVGCQSSIIESVRRVTWKNGIPLHKYKFWSRDVTSINSKPGFKHFDVYGKNVAMKILIPVAVVLLLLAVFAGWYLRKRSRPHQPIDG